MSSEKNQSRFVRVWIWIVFRIVTVPAGDVWKTDLSSVVLRNTFHKVFELIRNLHMGICADEVHN